MKDYQLLKKMCSLHRTPHPTKPRYVLLVVLLLGSCHNVKRWPASPAMQFGRDDRMICADGIPTEKGYPITWPARKDGFCYEKDGIRLSIYRSAVTVVTLAVR